jgi:hypothetical protein
MKKLINDPTTVVTTRWLESRPHSGAAADHEHKVIYRADSPVVAGRPDSAA